ncbi:MAG: hypothetical protein WA418_20640, partial [Bradyrhizobium sp.]
DLGEHLGAILDFCYVMVKQEKPALVGYEQPSIFNKTTPATTTKLSCYGPALEKVCHRRRGLGVPVRQINPSKCGMFWNGKGLKGQAKKDETVRRAKLYGFAVRNDDEADAIADFFLMVEFYGTEEQKRFFHQMRTEGDFGVQQKIGF